MKDTKQTVDLDLPIKLHGSTQHTGEVNGVPDQGSGIEHVGIFKMTRFILKEGRFSHTVQRVILANGQLFPYEATNQGC